MRFLQYAQRYFLMPPYRGVPVAVWLYTLICCLCFSVSGPLNGYLIGFDDHVRMLQVLNWINGASWYDRLITRVDAPDGFITIWSRLVDLPIALTVLIGQIITDQRHAAILASFILPLIELAILFFAARYAARVLVGKNNARVVVLFVMFTTVMNYKDFSIAGFHPGEASHHPWYLILMLLAVGAVGRIAIGGKAVRMLALSAALMLAVGIEAMPLLAIVTAITGFTAWHESRAEIAAKTTCGLGWGAFGALILLPIHQAPAHWLTISFAEPSILGAILVASAALFLSIESKILRQSRQTKSVNLILILIVCIFISGTLVLLFPDILNGPAAALTPQERVLAFHEHSEAQPLFSVAHGWLDFVCLSMPLFIAAITGFYALRHDTCRRTHAMKFLYLGIFIAVAVLSLALSRFYHHASLLACLWLLWAWTGLKKKYAYKKPVIALVLFIGLSPLWLLFLPTTYTPYLDLKHVLLFPALRQSMPEPCNPRDFGAYLNAHYSKETLLMAQGGDSTRLLYYSDLKIDFLNLYPSHNKFIDNETFYATQDLHIAADIARRHKIDLVALCPMPVMAPPLQPGEEPMLFERLQNGGSVQWLTQIDTGVKGDYLLFAVDKKKLAQF